MLGKILQNRLAGPGRGAAIAVALFAVCGLAAVPAARGQEAEEEAVVQPPARQHPGIEEITVRARRRAELLEDIPVSVTALGNSFLDATQATNLEDISALVPNLTILSGRSGQDSSVVIRGIGAFPFTFFDQGVGTYVDGIFLARQQGSLFDIVDIQEIEVLRGPQGTLFGKNTIGGAINITTAKPERELGAKLSVRTGSFDLAETRTVLNIPIPWGWFDDKLFTRFTIGTSNDRGYTKNLETGEYYSDKNAVNFYGAVRLEPVDNVDLTVTGQWSRNHNRGLGGRCVVLQERFDADGNPIFPAAPFLPQDFYDRCRESEPFRFRSDQHALSDVISDGVWGNFGWDLGQIGFLDDISLRYRGAWREQTTRTKDDAEMTALPVFAIRAAGEDDLNGGPQDANQIQQELQVNAEANDLSSFGTNLNLVAGAFGYWENSSANMDLLFLSGNPTIDIVGGTTHNFISTANWDWALYGQLVFDVTDWLSLTGGVRYTREKKALKRFVTNAVTGVEQVNFDLRDEFNGWTPMASIVFNTPASWLEATGFIDHLAPYFTYSRGFRGGGFNGQARTTEEGEGFDPEFADAYEVGVKTSLWERRVSLSGALFEIDTDNQQVPQLVQDDCPPDMPDCLPLTKVFIRNAAKSRSRGFEIETLAAPVNGLTINGNVGFTFSEFLDFPEAEQALTGETINRAGERQAFTPKWQTTLGLQYVYDLPALPFDRANGSIVSRVDWYFESTVYNFAPEVEGLKQPGYHRVNLRLGYLFNDEHSEIAFWAKNLTDSEYFKNALSWPRLTGTGIRYYEPPRTFGVELNHRFS